MQDIKELNLSELKAVLKGWGEAEFRAQQIFSWIYKKGALDFATMSDLPSGLKSRLKEGFYVSGLKLFKAFESADGTKKLLFELKDKNIIEAVSIPTEARVTGCVSTQVGCKFSCSFCASGFGGFKRNLTRGEIIEEVLFLKNNSKAKLLTHLVFMGTGEPLDNYDNLIKAIRIINSAQSLNIGARRITISTCGIVPGIKKLIQENLQIELSVSLHAADDKTRSRLLPVNKKYPLGQLVKACKEYSAETGRQITFEYILIKGINSDLQNAAKLVTILKGLRLCKVNLIAANPIKELNLEPPDRVDILSFKNHLLKFGVNATLRRPRGEDIDAACGQLRLRYEK